KIAAKYIMSEHIIHAVIKQYSTYYSKADHHVDPHSFPTRRSSDLTIVPTTKLSRMDIAFMNPWEKRYMRMINNSVPNAKEILERDPKSLAPCPPPILLIATGIKVIPIIVTTDPVTTGGKKRTNLPKKRLIRITNKPETRIAP